MNQLIRRFERKSSIKLMNASRSSALLMIILATISIATAQTITELEPNDIRTDSGVKYIYQSTTISGTIEAGGRDFYLMSREDVMTPAFYNAEINLSTLPANVQVWGQLYSAGYTGSQIGGDFDLHGSFNAWSTAWRDNDRYSGFYVYNPTGSPISYNIEVNGQFGDYPSCPAPGASESLSLSTTGGTSVRLNSYTAASNADGYIIVMNSTNSFSTLSESQYGLGAIAVDGTAWSNSGEQVLAKVTTNSPSLNITGLSPSTTYYFKVYPYRECYGFFLPDNSTVSASVTTPKNTPTITFSNITATYGDSDITLGATTNSDGTLSYSLIGETTGTSVSGSTLILGDPGTMTVRASTTETATYAAGEEDVTLTINKLTGTVMLANLIHTYDGSTKSATASTSPGIYTVDITYNGSSTAPTNAGSYTVIGTINDTYYQGNDTQTMTINKADQTISFGALVNKTFGDPTFSLTATASSGGSVSYTSSNTSVATVSGSTVTIVGTGTTNITAFQAGDGNYNAATNVEQSLTVDKADQTITFGALPAKSVGDPEFSLNATASSGLTVSYASSNTAVATVSGNSVTIVGAGTTQITASQAGDDDYNLATNVNQNFEVSVAITQVVVNSTATGVCTKEVMIDLSSAQSDVDYYLLNNADSSIFEGPVAASAGTVSFSTQTISSATTFLVAGVTAADTLYMDTKPSITVGASNQTVSLNQPDAQSADVSLAGSEIGMNYFLLNNTSDEILDGPLAGTGAGISFPTQGISETTTFKVIGTEDANLVYEKPTLQFDDVGYVTVPGTLNDDLTSTEAITLETWAYVPSADNYGERTSLITQRYNGSTIKFQITIDGSANNGTAILEAGFFTGSWRTATSSFPNDKWIHIAATYDRNFIRIYIDGVQTGFQFQNFFLPNANTEWYLGRRWDDAGGASSQKFSGQLAETRIWNLTRSQSQIANSRFSLANNDRNGLVLEYNYPDGTGTTVSDDSGNGHDGTLTNFTVTDASNWDVYNSACNLVMSNTPTATFSKLEVSTSEVSFNAPASLVYNAATKVYTVSVDAGASAKLPVSDLDITYQGRNGTAYASSSVAPVEAGDYTVIATVNASNIYYFGSVNADFSITAKPITVTAEAKSKVYSESDPALTYGVSPSLESGDAFTGGLTRAAGEEVGRYLISENDLSAGSNYVITYVEDSLTIAAKPITVTADAKTKVYGESDPAFTYQVSPALESGDGFSGSLNREAGDNAGKYIINQNDLTAGANYAITYIEDSLTITAKAITLTADAKTKVYGESDPTFTYQVSQALESGDGFTGSLSRGAGNDVGKYIILQNDLSAGTNYNITYIGDSLTITAKAITVTANAQTKVFGESDPTFTYQVNPALESGDGFTGGLSREAGDNVGNYAILQNDLSASLNYDLTYSRDSLTITKATAMVTLDSITPKTYGTDAGFDLSANLTSGAGDSLYTIDDESIITFEGDCGNDVCVLKAGTTFISLQQLGNSNYEASNIVSRTVTVNKADQTISLGALSDKTFGDPDFTLPETTNAGLTINYTSSNTDVATISGNTVTVIAVGSTNITASQIGNDNYNAASDVVQPLTVNEKPITAAVELVDTTIVVSAFNKWTNSPFKALYSFSEPVAGFGVVNVRTNAGSVEAVSSIGDTIFLVDIDPTAEVDFTEISLSVQGLDNYDVNVSANSLFYIESHIWNDEAWFGTGNHAGVPVETNDAFIVSNYEGMAFACKDLTIDQDVQLKITPNSFGNLVVKGNIENNGFVGLPSAVSLVNYGLISGTGTFGIERITSHSKEVGKYSFVGSPIMKGKFDSLGSVLYEYDETIEFQTGTKDGLDNYISPSTIDMVPGRGYASAFTGTVIFEGTPNTGDLSVDVTKTDYILPEDTNNEGFNIIANPYPCAINFEKFYMANTNSGVLGGGIWLWDDDNSQVLRGSSSDFITVTLLGHVGGNFKNDKEWKNHIGTAQGFFVKVDAGYGTHQVSFADSMKVQGHNADSSFFRFGTPHLDKIMMSLSSEDGSYDESLIGFRNDATKGADNLYDAPKIDAMTGLRLYSMIDSNTYAIQALPISRETREVPLGMHTTEAGSYTISWDVYGYTIREAEQVWLRDAKTGKLIELGAEANYTFDAEAGTDNDRFALVLKTNEVTQVKAIVSLAMLAHVDVDQNLVLQFDRELRGMNVSMYDISGREILSVTRANTEASRWRTALNGIPPGIYMILVETQDGIAKQKIKVD